MMIKAQISKEPKKLTADDLLGSYNLRTSYDLFFLVFLNLNYIQGL